MHIHIESKSILIFHVIETEEVEISIPMAQIKNILGISCQNPEHQRNT